MPQRVRTVFIPPTRGLQAAENFSTANLGGFKDFRDFALSGELENVVVQAEPPDSVWTPEDGVGINTLHAGRDASGGVYLYAAGGTKVYQKKIGGSAATVKTGLTADQDFSVAVMNDSSGTPTAYFFNGTDTPFKTLVQATPSVSNIGLARPDVSTGATSALGSAGQVKGTVKYFIAQMSGTTEGALSAEFGEIDAKDGNQVDVTLDDSEFYSKTYRLYRTTANRHAPRYVTTITVAAATPGTTYTDDTPDSELGDVPFLHGDPPPATASLAISYLNRLWIVDKNKVYPSDLGNPESFWTSDNGNVIKVQPEDGEVIVAVAVDEDGLVFFKENHIYRLIGKKLEELELVDVSGSGPQSQSLGTTGANTVVPSSRGLVFSRGNRIFRLRGNQTSLLARHPGTGKGPDTTSFVLGYSPKYDALYASDQVGGLGGDSYVMDMSETSYWSAVYGKSAKWFAPIAGTLYFVSGDTGDTDNIFSYPTRYWQTDSSQKWDTALGDPTPAFLMTPERFWGDDLTQLKRFLWVDVFVEHNRDVNIQVTPTVDTTSQSAMSVSATGASVGDLNVFRFPINTEGYTLELDIVHTVFSSTKYANVRYYGFKYAWVDLDNTLKVDPS